MARPLRIAMLSTFYPPHNFGGDGIAIQRMSRALARRGHEVTVVHDSDAYRTLHRGPEPAPIEEPEGVRVIGLESGAGWRSPLLNQQFGRPVMTGRRLGELLDDGFDIIHYNNVSLLGGPGLLELGTGLKVYEAHEHWLVCPTHVLWRHGRELCTGRECLRCVLSYRRPPQIWRYTGRLEESLSEIDVFIAKSEFSRDKHAEFGFSRPMEVLPYFLPDIENDSTTSRSPAASPHDRPYFLFVGRLEKIKGLDDVIPAFERYEDADLLIAGDGNYRAHLETLAAGNPRVRFLGRLDPEELDRYYRAAEALVVPSICYETFGIILIESFRQGTPVIARRLGPLPEIVEKAGGGELFGTTEELVDAMRRMRDDPEHRDACASRAREAFSEHWSESTVVPAYLNLVGEAAERRGHHHVARAILEAA